MKLFKKKVNKLINIEFSNKKNYILEFNSCIVMDENKIIKPKSTPKKVTKRSSKHDDLLKANLKYLEFITFLEMNYNQKILSSFSAEFVQSLEQIKNEAQKATLDLINTKK